MQRSKLAYKLLMFAAVALILIATMVVPASAAELTVGTDGQYKTIQQAVDAAKSGDTILVAPGTYTEKIVVNKPLTITAGSGRPTVQAADSSGDVFLLTSSGVHIDGLKITGGASGVHIQQTSMCTVKNIVARDNKRAVYLSYSSNNKVSDSDLAGNGYGVYSDYSSNNTVASNVATSETGADNALGDGIYLYYGDSNTVTDNNLSVNRDYGISLYYSTHNSISNNTISNNEQIGVRLGEASNNNTLTFNTISGNTDLGVLILKATGNQIYLNNFISQSSAISDASAAILNSPEKLVYTFNGVERTGYMSNYYSDYKGTDATGTGIGSTPSTYGDKYPLVKPVASYGNITPLSAVTPTPTLQNESSTAVSENQSVNETKLPGFEAVSTAAGLAIALIVLLGQKNRAK
jgi:parallel beta-helix repeat protein